MSTLVLLMYAAVNVIVTVLGQGCEKVHVSGTEFRHEVSGIYQKIYDGDTALKCHNRSVYEQINGGYYLYFYEGSFSSLWLISPYNCSSRANVQVEDTAVVPENITSLWLEAYVEEENNTVVWDPSIYMAVRCFHEFGGCDHISVNGIHHRNPHYDMNGVYDVMLTEELCYGKYTYKRKKEEYFMFSYIGNWIISNETCVSHGFAVVGDGTLYPEGVTSPWEETKIQPDGNISWVSSGLFVKCKFFLSCEKVLADGTKYRNDTSGLYKVEKDGSFHRECNGKPVFQQSNGDLYMYYYTLPSYTAWHISRSSCSRSYIIRLENVSDVIGHTGVAVWEAVVDDDHKLEVDMDVKCYEGFAGCDSVMISGLTVTDANDIYDKTTSTCNGRYTYTSGEYYLYAIHGLWVLSDEECHTEGFARVEDGAFYPQDITTGWEEYEGITTTFGTWRAQDISVICSEPDPTTTGSNGNNLFDPVTMIFLILCTLILARM